jgi:AraC-like DNA-binding protein
LGEQQLRTEGNTYADDRRDYRLSAHDTWVPGRRSEDRANLRKGPALSATANRIGTPELMALFVSPGVRWIRVSTVHAWRQSEVSVDCTMKRRIVFKNDDVEIVSHHSPPALYREEHHDAVQICIPLGNAWYVVQRQSVTGKMITHRLGARDILVIPKGQPHVVDWRRSADIVSLLVSERFVRRATGLDNLPLPDTFTIRDPFITASAAEIRSSVEENARSPVFAEALATVIVYRVGLRAGLKESRNEKHCVPEFSSAQATRIVEFLDNRLDRSISLDDLAQLTGFTKWHFMRRFNTTYGTSPHNFITDRRIARAKQLLVSSELPIVQVAIEVGMTHNHFSRTFLKRVGLSPSEFRQQKGA